MQNYELKYQTLLINDVGYSIRSLKDRQQFHDEGGLAEQLGISSATWPLFGVVWPASRILATQVSQMDLAGRRVLELGCGIALASIVLHNMGVDITASDYHPLTLEFLEENIRRNDFLPIKFETGNWGADNPRLGIFDVIIGSDILYEPAHPALVANFIQLHCAQVSEVIIVDPDRGNRVHFTRRMLALGFEYSHERFRVEGDQYDRCKGSILHYTRH